MTFRSRLLIGFGAVVVGPLVVFGLGIRRGIAARLTVQYQGQVQASVAAIRADLTARSDAIAGRLRELSAAATQDNRLRLATLGGGGAEQPYLLDYAGTAMRLAGLSFLQIQDGNGRIVSSGHFRNEFDRLEPELPRLLAGTGRLTLIHGRTAEGPILALVRVDSLRLGGQRYALVGGVTVDSLLLAQLTRDTALAVALDTLGRADTSSGVVGTVPLPAITAEPARLVPARIVVSHTLAGLDALRHDVDRWFLAALALTAAVAVLLAAWLTTRLTRPITALADRTARIDLETLDVDFASARDDEVGTLSRMLGAMTERLRAGAARLREAERRVAMGDLARQVNHDVKNGLIPIRNVFRHLGQVARDDPAALPSVFAERQGTVDSSIGYLERLAGNYARLYPEGSREPCDVNAVVTETARRYGGDVRLELAPSLPEVPADHLVLRRILENLLGNAFDAVNGKGGTVRVATARVTTDGGTAVRIAVADTGRGMTGTELEHAFDPFYTTKPGGTGLGLPIVRRLVLDAGGRLTVETQPGSGSTFIVELPCDGTATP